MKPLILTIILLLTPLFADVQHLFLNNKILHSNIPIVDIRTPGEWSDTGLLKGSIPIMFFDEKGGYNLEQFLKTLQQKVDTKKTFALICNSGSRTRMVADYLSTNYGYHIIDLRGGIRYAIGKSFPIEPYPPKP